MVNKLDTLKAVKKTIRKRNLFKKTNYLMLMVSGGSDSVALCYIINEIVGKDRFAIMHLNHNIRKDSSEDEAFVSNLSKYLGVPYFSFNENVLEISKNNRQNMEACGRELRYQSANKATNLWCKQSNIAQDKVLICSAHNADDRIENFYMRSIVGTGPGGFASLNYSNENVVRPLLDVAKEKLIDYINNLENKYTDKNGLAWHEDYTNADTDKFRAYVRHNIIPLAKKQNTKIIDNLCNSMNLIADENDYMEQQVSKIIDKYFEFNDKSFSILPDFNKENIALKRRAIYNSLIKVFKKGTRLETKSISSILTACEQSNYTDNIQENYSVHSNKNGVLVQPMEKYRKSRKRI